MGRKRFIRNIRNKYSSKEKATLIRTQIDCFLTHKIKTYGEKDLESEISELLHEERGFLSSRPGT